MAQQALAEDSPTVDALALEPPTWYPAVGVSSATELDIEKVWDFLGAAKRR